MRRFSNSLPPPRQLPQKRVVVTGLGLVTPLGTGVKKNWTNLINGKCGIDTIRRFDPTSFDLPCHIAAEVKESGPDAFSLEDWVPKEIRSQIPLFVAFAIAAAKQALDDSGWNGDRNTAGVAIGGGIGSLGEVMSSYDTLKEKGYKRISPYFIPKILINMSSGYVSMLHGLKGPNHAVATACATGVHAIGDAAGFIQRGMATAMLAGATEASTVSLAIAGFCRAKALTTLYNTRPSEASRPFDINRDGFVLGEGAGMVMLEEMESALSRGAPIYGEVRGYGLSGEAYHVTQPTQDGVAARRCMEQAIWMSGLEPHDVDYINAHATSTLLGDRAEVKAITDLFGNHTNNLSVSSTKGATGHLMGAAGVVEAIYTLLALKEGLLPPTLNLEKLDPELNPNIDYIPKIAKKKNIRVALTNSFGFGGTNASLVLSRVEDM